MNGKQLRASILQEAIAGRLVPQDPADEPASELLHRINPKATPLQTDEPLPQGWCACTVSTVAKTFTGNSINKEEKEKKYTGLSTGYNYIATKDVGFDGVIDYENGIKIPFKTKFKIAHKGSTLLCIEGGSAGRKIGLLTEDVCFVNKLCAFEPKGIDEKYLYYYLQSPAFVNVFRNNKTGMIGGVTKTALASLPVYLPPLAEQKRIVAKIEELMPLVDEYEKAQEEFNNLNAGLKSKLRASLLQEAIAGRLVPQDPSDEPASELLKRIAPKATPIQGDLPFEIPDNWEWCRLKDICVFLSRGKSPKYSEEKRYPVFAQKCNLKDGWISLDNARFLDPDTIGKWHDKYKLRTGDILVNSTGTGTVCRTRRFDEKCLGPYPFVVPDSHVSVVRTHKDVSSYFILHYISSQCTQQYLEDNLAGSTNQKELYIGVLENLPIPLPPLAEQKRIVEKLESMFAMLDKLDALTA